MPRPVQQDLAPRHQYRRPDDSAKDGQSPTDGMVVSRDVPGTKRYPGTLEMRIAGDRSIGTLTGRTSRIAFIMPRHAHDNIRVAHKEAWSLKDQGYDVVLPTREVYIKGPGMIFKGNPK